VHLHFGRTQVVEQTLFHRDAPAERRVLRFRVTDLDRMLAPLDAGAR